MMSAGVQCVTIVCMLLLANNSNFSRLHERTITLLHYGNAYFDCIDVHVQCMYIIIYM